MTSTNCFASGPIRLGLSVLPKGHQDPHYSWNRHHQRWVSLLELHLVWRCLGGRDWVGSLSMAKLAIPTRRAQATTYRGPHPISPISDQCNWGRIQHIPPVSLGPSPFLGAHIFKFQRWHPRVDARSPWPRPSWSLGAGVAPGSGRGPRGNPGARLR